jgi:hypothetical protein
MWTTVLSGVGSNSVVWRKWIIPIGVGTLFRIVYLFRIA